MKTPDIEPVALRLMALDRKIAEVAQMASRLIDAGAGLGRVEDEIAFLRILYRRRDVVLNEYRKEGGDVRDLYTHDARATGGDDDGPAAGVDHLEHVDLAQQPDGGGATDRR